MNDFTRPAEPHYELPGVASYYPRQGRLRTSIDSPTLATVGNASWALALLAGAAALLTMDPKVAQALVSILEIPLTDATVPHLWQFFTVAAAAFFVFGRAAHSINNHYPGR
jgi:hypothetical protein